MIKVIRINRISNDFNPQFEIFYIEFNIFKKSYNHNIYTTIYILEYILNKKERKRKKYFSGYLN